MTTSTEAGDAAPRAEAPEEAFRDERAPEQPSINDQAEDAGAIALEEALDAVEAVLLALGEAAAVRGGLPAPGKLWRFVSGLAAAARVSRGIARAAEGQAA